MFDDKDQNKDKPVITSKNDDKDKDVKQQVPLAALHEEREKRRGLEDRLKAFEAADKKNQEEELSFKEKFEKRDAEYDSLLKDKEKAGLRNQAIQTLIDDGFPKIVIEPVIKLADLTEDNIDKTIKSVAKEYENYKTSKKPTSSLLHPSVNQEEDKVRTQADMAKDAEKLFNDNIK